MKKAAALLACMLAATAGSASVPPRPSSRVVQAIVGDLSHGGEHVTAAQVRRGLKTVDIDGDGRPDYHFSKEALGPGWCGSGGCWIQLWLDRSPGPPLKIFDGQVREVRFRPAGRARIVDLDLHGSVCHTFGAHACPASFRWDGKLGRLVETAAPGGRGIVRLLRPTETTDGTPPAAVAAAFRTAVAACAAAGGSAADPERPLTVPDIDGDGLRDWIIPDFYCDIAEGQAAKAPPMTIFASAGHPAEPLVAASAARLEVDAAATPAAVFAVDLDTCSPEAMQPQACRRHRLTWSRERKRLLPEVRPGKASR